VPPFFIAALFLLTMLSVFVSGGSSVCSTQYLRHGWLYPISCSSTSCLFPHVPSPKPLAPLSEQSNLERLKCSCMQKQSMMNLGKITVEHKGPWGWQVPPGLSGSTSGHLRIRFLHAVSKYSCGSSCKS